MPKKYVMISLISVVVISVAILVFAYPVPRTTSLDLSASTSMRDRFSVLSNAGTDVCAYLGNAQAIDKQIYSLSDTSYLQGSCCSPMDFNSYVQQIDGLKSYSHISQVPPDPYNVPAPLAKELLGYDTSISLSKEQQMTLGQASKMSDDKGPCCCKCWAWYTHEGLAKYLIVHYNYDAKQVATLWNYEDCCGGTAPKNGFAVA